MSGGFAVLLEQRYNHHPFELGGMGGFIDEPDSSSNGGSSAAMGSGNGYTDDDLLASLAGFGVEGQTERDLATIKAMLAAQFHANNSQSNPAYFQQGQNQSHYQQQQVQGNSIWPINMPNNPFMQVHSSQQQFNMYGSPNVAQPPPNTPTLGKSLELYGELGYINSGGSSSRRRDVSLDRNLSSSPYNNTTGPASGSLQRTTTPLTMDMDMEADSSDTSTSYKIPHTYMGRRPSLNPRNVTMDQMEEIEEELEQNPTPPLQGQPSFDEANSYTTSSSPSTTNSPFSPPIPTTLPSTTSNGRSGKSVDPPNGSPPIQHNLQQQSNFHIPQTRSRSRLAGQAGFGFQQL